MPKCTTELRAVGITSTNRLTQIFNKYLPCNAAKDGHKPVCKMQSENQIINPNKKGRIMKQQFIHCELECNSLKCKTRWTAEIASWRIEGNRIARMLEFCPVCGRMDSPYIVRQIAIIEKEAA